MSDNTKLDTGRAEKAKVEQLAAEWLKSKGYDRKIWKSASTIISDFVEENQNLFSKNLLQQNQWISVKERLPKHRENVLGFINGKHRAVVFYLEKFKEIADEYDDPDDVDYDKEADQSYWKEGWHEEIEQFQHEYDFVWTSRKVTHWQPLPEPPQLLEGLTKNNEG